MFLMFLLIIFVIFHQVIFIKFRYNTDNFWAFSYYILTLYYKMPKNVCESNSWNKVTLCPTLGWHYVRMTFCPRDIMSIGILSAWHFVRLPAYQTPLRFQKQAYNSSDGSISLFHFDTISIRYWLNIAISISIFSK
jgi:hypothetical protein